MNLMKEILPPLYDEGLIPINDLLRSRVELANAKQSLITKINDEEMALSQLKTLLGYDIERNIDIKDTLYIKPWNMALSQCLEQAKEKRPEMFIARKTVRKTELEKK